LPKVPQRERLTCSGVYALIGAMGGKWKTITAFLGLGSNLGERLTTLQGARRTLARHSQLELVASSPVYETAPVGGPPGQGPYLNAVLQISTDLAPRQLLTLCQMVEESFARRREQHWGARTLDIDLLLYGALLQDDADLRLPHSSLHLRRFVLAPLADLAPHLPHPRLGRSVSQLLEQLATDQDISLLHKEW
jgi:2-amino-4-hydroxy-6-hydroxymethyldihydropteridine diphosphokinase